MISLEAEFENTVKEARQLGIKSIWIDVSIIVSKDTPFTHVCIEKEVVEISEIFFSKPGKTGGKKIIIEGKSFFDGKIWKQLFRVSEKIEIPILEDGVCEVVDIEDGELAMIDEDGEYVVVSVDASHKEKNIVPILDELLGKLNGEDDKLINVKVKKYGDIVRLWEIVD